MSTEIEEISEKEISDYTDYGTITRIRNILKKRKICVIKRAKRVFIALLMGTASLVTLNPDLSSGQVYFRLKPKLRINVTKERAATENMGT